MVYTRQGSKGGHMLVPEAIADPELVRQELERILASQIFERAQRSQRFLRYLVAAALADPPTAIKEYDLALDVFDRGPGYDSTFEATVRVEAGRLRNRLREYYDEEGKNDTLLITVPKGSYRVVLSWREGRGEAPGPPSIVTPPPEPQPSWNTEAGNQSNRPAELPAAPETRQPLTRLSTLGLLGCLSLLLLGYKGWRLVEREQARPVAHTMAVLPLKNLSGDPAQDYFADGTTDELITELARIPNLRVVSWNSVQQEKNTQKPLAKIAEELRADVIVEGSVSRSGDIVRINTQLVDARIDNHLWSGSFEGRASEILVLEDTAAQEIVAHTRLVVAIGDQPLRGRRVATAVNLAAHDAYLRARNYFDRRDGVDSEREFRQALALDPAYAPAYAGLSLALLSQAIVSDGDTHQIVHNAMDAAQKCLELDPDNGDGLIARGALELQFLWQWEAAATDIHRGIALSPNNSYGHMLLGIYDAALGKPAEEVKHMQEAVAIDPLSFYMARQYGTALLFAGRYGEALRELDYAREMHPASADFVDHWVSQIYQKRGMPDEAVRYDLQELEDIDHDTYNSPLVVHQDTHRSQLLDVYKREGWRAYWAMRLKMLQQLRTRSACHGYDLAILAVRAGQSGLAFEELQQAANAHCYMILMLRVDPLLDEIRPDPRFQTLIDEAALPPTT